MKRTFALIFCLSLSASLLHAGIVELEKPSEKGFTKAERQSRTFSDNSRGWYWVYEGTAHAQSFTSGGTRIERLWLRPARLNASQPTAALRVEVRDWTLKRVYAQGHIRAEEAEREFRWLPVDFNYRAPLTPGAEYVLLLSSPDTGHAAPWVINAVYRDLYPDGRHLGYSDDLFFRMAFKNEEIRVGPGAGADLDMPVNSGLRGTQRKLGPVALSARYPAAAEAAKDPVGPIPPGVKVSIHGSAQRVD